MIHRNYEDWIDQGPNICPYDDGVPGSYIMEDKILLAWWMENIWE